MKDAIAIAIAKAKSKTQRKLYNDLSTPENSAESELEITRTWMGVVLMIGVFIGFGAVVCFVVGLINSGGPLQFFSRWISAMTGI